MMSIVVIAVDYSRIKCNPPLPARWSESSPKLICLAHTRAVPQPTGSFYPFTRLFDPVLIVSNSNGIQIREHTVLANHSFIVDL